VIVGGLFSVIAGLLLATVAYGIILLLAGSPTEGGYCSPNGRIGQYETRNYKKVVSYLDEGWGGFPPSMSCSVYLTSATNENPPLSAEEALLREPPPHHLLAHGSYPGSREYTWVIGLLLLPSAIWCLLTAATRPGRRLESFL
jgi:hypothetical protein